MKSRESLKLAQQSPNLIDTLANKNNEVLAAHIVTFRHLGINKELAIASMQILAQRKKEGSDFDYQSYIEEKLAEAPSPQMDEKQKSAIQNIIKLDLNKID